MKAATGPAKRPATGRRRALRRAATTTEGAPAAGPARNDGRALVDRAWRKLGGIDAAYDAGTLDDDGWHAAAAAIVRPACLAADTPWGQSGMSGGWTDARRPIVGAIDRDGTFLDVGCANGYLVETLTAWAAERGRRIDPYGVDIVPELVELARRRLPHWADRFVTANAMQWRPHRRFDLVRTGLDYVPARRRPAYLGHLLDRVVTPGGRLVVGPQNELRAEPPLVDAVESWGFEVAGRAEWPHRDPRACRTLLWIDAPDR